ncbi:MAG: hypothetical protein K1X81_07420 [Bacteroidia bacterium]|nr:hypothetical protein [Bacteroidia bacterium]
MKTTNLLLKALILSGLFLLFTPKAKAQDLIILKQKSDTLKARVTEVGVDEIKYKLWPVNETDPVMVMEKKKIRKVLLESGTVLNFFLEDMDDPKNYVGQRKHLLKMDIISPTLGVSSFAYEKSIRPGRSYEVGLGIVGLGFNTSGTEMAGAFVRTGYKFINTPDITMRGMRFSHLLKGGYIRPELMFINYTFKSQYYGYPASYSTFRTTGGALFINFGKQYVYSNRFAVDLFAGLGIGTQHTVATSGAGGGWDFYFNGIGFVSGMGGEITPAFQCGLKMGILLGKTEEKTK